MFFYYCNYLCVCTQIANDISNIDHVSQVNSHYKYFYRKFLCLNEDINVLEKHKLSDV